MQKRESSFTSTDRSALKLILVMKQDRLLGTKLVDLIQTQTPFRAILAPSLLQAHAILHQLACDYLLVTDNDFPEEDLNRLCLLPAQRKPLVHRGSNSSTIGRESCVGPLDRFGHRAIVIGDKSQDLVA